MTHKRLFLVLFIIIGLFCLWHSSLLLTLLRPTLIRQGVVRLQNVETAQDDRVTYGVLGIDAPLSVDAQTSPLVQSDWSAIRLALLHGTSLSYEGTDFASAPIAFLTGHSSDVTRHPYDSVFAPLGQAAVGDTFQVLVDHVQYQYRVISKEQIAPSNADAFLALSPTNSSHRVALVTCWPPLTTKTRMVVVGQRL